MFGSLYQKLIKKYEMKNLQNLIRKLNNYQLLDQKRLIFVQIMRINSFKYNLMKQMKIIIVKIIVINNNFRKFEENIFRNMIQILNITK